jgi:Tol biopolymer transport system component
MIRTKLRWAAAALALASFGVAPALSAWAGKPGGGGGGGPVDSGTIYSRVPSGSTYQVYRMNPDGTGKTALPVYLPFYDGPSDPSRSLHNGHRSFIVKMPVPGEINYDGTGPKRELFAVRDDGASVRLTYSTADIEVSSTHNRWGPQDTRIAYWRQRFDGTRLQRDGVCVADVAFDGSGNIAGLVSTPTAPAIATPSGSLSFDGLAWSPDGTRLAVSDKFDASGGAHEVLRSVDLATLTSATLTTHDVIENLEWSPDGGSIAYDSGATIFAVNADGTNDHAVETAHYSGATYISYNSPQWSPNGVNLVMRYGAWKSSTSGRSDVVRCVPTGGAVTNLSSDLTAVTDPRPIGWR